MGSKKFIICGVEIPVFHTTISRMFFTSVGILQNEKGCLCRRLKCEMAGEIGSNTIKYHRRHVGHAGTEGKFRR